MIHWEKLRLVVIFICFFPHGVQFWNVIFWGMLHIENDIFLQWMIWSKYWFQCVTCFLFRCQRNFFFQNRFFFLLSLAMSFSCPFCPGKTFKTQAHLKSHQTQKKCGVKKERKISPSNPFLKYFKAKPSPNPSPRIVEPPAEAGRPNPPGRSSRSFSAKLEGPRRGPEVKAIAFTAEPYWNSPPWVRSVLEMRTTISTPPRFPQIGVTWTS